MSSTSDQPHAPSTAGLRPAEGALLPRLAAVILAAGKGTRMNSDLPKVVHVAAGKPLVRWVTESCRAVGASPIVLVVGHQAERVREVFAGDDADLRFALQAQQLGTGHAVLQAKEALLASASSSPAEDCLVLYGDGPLIRPATLRTLVERHRATGAAATLATSVLADPTGYGRILRDAGGAFLGIREQKDAAPEELAIREVNPGYYCFRAADLFEALSRVGAANASGEIYLTDVFALLLEAGRRVEVVAAAPPEDVLSVNTPEQLRAVEQILQRRGAGEDASATAPLAPEWRQRRPAAPSASKP